MVAFFLRYIFVYTIDPSHTQLHQKWGNRWASFKLKQFRSPIRSLGHHILILWFPTPCKMLLDCPTHRQKFHQRVSKHTIFFSSRLNEMTHVFKSRTGSLLNFHFSYYLLQYANKTPGTLAIVTVFSTRLC